MICNACGDIGTINLGEGYVLCSRCEEIFTREFPHLSNQLSRVVASSSGKSAAAHPSAPIPGAAATTFDDGIPEILRRKRIAA